MTLVVLDEDELRQAARYGIERMIHVIVDGRNNTHGESDWGAWQRHVEGAMGERAVASYLGIDWDPHIGRVDKPDLVKKGVIVEVRTTRRPNGHLIVNDDDKQDAVFVLVTGMNGRYRLIGWIWSLDAMNSEFWGKKGDPNRPPAFWVPQHKLNPMRELV